MVDSQDRPYARKLERHEATIAIAVKVVDAVNNSHIGRLVNVHTEGMMIVGEQQLPANNLYQFELHLPDGAIIPVGVDCLWSNGNSEETLFWAGCKIIDISDQALADLEALIQFFAA